MLAFGQRFGRLVVLATAHRVGRKQYWHCACECGRQKAIRSDALVGGRAKSCGCLMRELNGARLAATETSHGHTVGKKLSPTFQSWRGMIERCRSPKHQQYRFYGGRGIYICGRWLEFANFLADMGERPDGMTLDRKDSNGHYEPDNCRWATKRTQSNNTRSNVFHEHDGKRLTASGWAELSGIKYHTLYARLKAGWPISQALSEPVQCQ